ncbi:MAG TPA: DNA-binding response regulator [Stenotrophomonas sp.]|nr:DNA-binding response regulator [Stenotrophomonas sp.]
METENPMHRLLIVDDDNDIRTLLAEQLGRAGYQVSTAADGTAMRQLLDREHVDLIVLDLNLPREDGLTLCRDLRARSNTPVIMLTARAEPIDRVLGLEMGADDYLAKPFEPRELLLRIESILRRAAPRPSGPRVLSLGECAFEPERGELTRQGEPIRLTEAEVALLRRLAKVAHEAVDRLELARDTVDATGRAVDVQVTRLRRKIEPDPKNPRYLQTVRGVGYRLAPD